MEIEIVELEERKCKFILKNSTPAKANALRRTMLSDIPKMAIDDVQITHSLARVTQMAPRTRLRIQSI